MKEFTLTNESVYIRQSALQVEYQIKHADVLLHCFKYKSRYKSKLSTPTDTQQQFEINTRTMQRNSDIFRNSKRSPIEVSIDSQSSSRIARALPSIISS